MPVTKIAGRTRDLLFFSTPAMWEDWPFLPIIRRTEDSMEPGLLYDCPSLRTRLGESITVFLCNLFQLPESEDDFLALPRQSFSSVEEMYAAGWRVD